MAMMLWSILSQSRSTWDMTVSFLERHAYAPATIMAKAEIFHTGEESCRPLIQGKNGILHSRVMTTEGKRQKDDGGRRCFLSTIITVRILRRIIPIPITSHIPIRQTSPYGQTIRSPTAIRCRWDCLQTRLSQKMSTAT